MSSKPKRPEFRPTPERTFFYLGLLTGIGVMLVILTGMSLGLLAQSNARAETARSSAVEAALLKAQAVFTQPEQGSAVTRWVEAVPAPVLYPLRNAAVPEPIITGAAAIVFDLTTERIFYEKDVHTPYLIASLSKLVSAQVSFEALPADAAVEIDEVSLAAAGEAGDFREGERLLVRDLIKAMLVASSNDAAVALARKLGESEFVRRMNEYAATLGLEATRFSNPTGLDDGENSATAFDMMRLILATLGNNQLWQTLSQSQATIYDLTARRPHRLFTTNRLLGQAAIYAGKTGFTTEAKGAYAAVFSLPSGQRLGLIVLRSDDRFGDALNLINWVKAAYYW